MHLDEWLRKTGAKGLDSLELADFPCTGRGVRAKRAFKRGEKILTIGGNALWTVKRAHDDELVGSILKNASLSVEDTLALYILFVRSRDSGYEGLKSHVAVLPASYTSSIFFTDNELEVCAGSSLYTVTKQLLLQVQESYKDIVARVVGPHQDLFPLDKFTLEDVSTISMQFIYSELTSVVQMGHLYCMESVYGLCLIKRQTNLCPPPLRRHVEPLRRATVSCIRSCI